MGFIGYPCIFTNAKTSSVALGISTNLILSHVWQSNPFENSSLIFHKVAKHLRWTIANLWDFGPIEVLIFFSRGLSGPLIKAMHIWVCTWPWLPSSFLMQIPTIHGVCISTFCLLKSLSKPDKFGSMAPGSPILWVHSQKGALRHASAPRARYPISVHGMRMYSQSIHYPAAHFLPKSSCGSQLLDWQIRILWPKGSSKYVIYV